LFGTDLADLINSLNSSTSTTLSKLTDRATRTSRGAAKILDSLNGGGDTSAQMQTLIDDLNAMTDAQITRNLHKLSPVSNRAMDVSMRQAMDANLDAVHIRLNNLRLSRNDYRASNEPILVAFNGSASGLLDADRNYGAWTKVVGTRSSQSAAGDFDGYRSDTSGVMFGGDMLFNNGWLAGGALSYGSTSVDYRNVSDGSNTDIDNYQLTGYASKWLGKTYVDLMFAYAFHRFDSSRDAGVGGVADANYNGDHIGIKGVWGLPIALDHSTELTPMVGLSISHLRTDSYTEKGAGVASLHVGSNSATRVRSSLGAQLQKLIYVQGEALRPSIELNWLHDFRTRGIDTSAAFSGGGAAFETRGQDLESNALGASAGLSWQMSRDALLSVRYNGEFASGYRSHQAELSAVWTF
jgi:outer membrane autotransporter protein